MVGAMAVGACLAQQPAFDAASVKVVAPPVPSSAVGGPGTSTPGRYLMRATRIQLLARAYDVPEDRISGGPGLTRDSMLSGVYEINATMAPDTTKEQFQSMLRNLLAERFHLRVHHETRNFPAYVLVVAKGGPKLKEVKPDPNPAPIPPGPSVMGKDGFPVLPPGPHTAQSWSGENWRFKYQERSMAELVATLPLMIVRGQGVSVLSDSGTRRPRVTDKTGLTGKYDFTLEFSCPACFAAVAVPVSAVGAPQPPGDASAAEAASEPAGGPTVFVALEKQLGLRLEKAKDIPLDVIVVDHIDKVPTEN